MSSGILKGVAVSCTEGGSLRRLCSLFVVGVLLCAGGIRDVGAQGQGTQVRVHSNSRFWIQGEATTHRFTCVVDRVEGKATLPPPKEALSSAQDRPARDEQQPTVVVRVPVRAFDCGNSRMTADLKETLQMEEHSTIRLELVHATVGDPVPGRPQWRQIEVLGTLTIAGKKRLRRIHLTGRAFGDERFRIRGCHPVRMTYFGIEPPTKAFGLIKVKNRVEVQFDLLAHAGSLSPDSAFAQVPTDDRSRPACGEQGD
jgi:hypothetical protein